MTHTPTPWKLTILENMEAFFIKEEETEKIISATYAEDENGKANAEFIVRAVNAHDELIEALTSSVYLLGVLGTPDDPIKNRAIEIANAALKAAGGKS